MKVVKTYKETMPDVNLIGKRFTDKDRDETGTFARYWKQCFQEDWQAALGACKGADGVSDDLVGAMRMTGSDGSFEYWIGSFKSSDADAPEGFESVAILAGDVGVCWLSGNEATGELYSMEASDLSMAALAEKGWKISESKWFFERYNNPRFTVADEQGNVILDICAYLEE